MKRILVIFPVIASFLFGYSCASKPKPAPTETYTFSFEGTKCKINNYFSYSKTLTKGDKNVVFNVDVNQTYMLPNDGVKIDGDNVDYNEETHKITISEVTGNIKVTATAREPVFTFEGSNCSINGNPSLTQKLRMGERISFKIDITQLDYVLLRENVLVVGKNWTFDEEKSIFTIEEVAGDVKVNAHAKTTKCVFTFTGTNCTIKGKKDFTKILNIGDEGVEFEVVFPDDYVLTKNKINISGKNVVYDEATHKITISKVVDDINITATANIPTFNFQGTYCTINGLSTYTQTLTVSEQATFDVTLVAATTLSKANVEITGYNTSYNETTHKITISNVASDVVVKATAIPKSFSFTSNLTNCYFEKAPLASYPVYSEVDLRIKADPYYKLPQNLIVEPSTLDYTYNPETGALTINSMPAENVKISAEGALGWIHIDNNYQIVLGGNQKDGCQDAHQINDALDYSNQAALKIVDPTKPSKDTEIVLDSERSEVQELLKTITDTDGYAIKVIKDKKKVVVAAKTKLARTCAVDRMLTNYYSKQGGLVIPIDCDIEGACKKSDIITEFNMPKDPDGTQHIIRDPFIVYENGKYYMYGTTEFHGIEWRVYSSEHLGFGWELCNSDITDGKPIKDMDEDAPDRWAPEIHKYTNPDTSETNYYMFTCYRNNLYEGDHHTGVVIFRSNSLTEGFTMISEHEGNRVRPGFIFDDKLSGLDGSLYVDSNKTPWMFYGGKYPDSNTNGRCYLLSKLTNDLSEIKDEGKPIKIFEPADKLDDYWWSNGSIGDGPFINKLSDGRLIMHFSNFDKDNDYAVGFLINKAGESKIDDRNSWVPQKRTLYRKDIYDGALPGGHSMTFSVGKQMYVCIHTPNNNSKAHPLIFPVKEAYGTLVWDLYLYSK